MRKLESAELIILNLTLRSLEQIQIFRIITRVDANEAL